jgi:hypothetical protein
MGDAAAFVAGIAFATGQRVVQLYSFRRRQGCVTFARHAILSRGQREDRYDQQADPE